jgi:hypothetical protein
MARLFSIALCVATAALTMPASSQESERYRIERTDDGYVRMDTQTGRVSVCREQAGQLVCQMAVEDQDAMQEDYAALGRRIEELEKRLAAVEKNVGTPLRVMPSEEEFDRSLGMMEKFFRRFMGIIQDIEKDAPGEEPKDRT